MKKWKQNKLKVETNWTCLVRYFFFEIVVSPYLRTHVTRYSSMPWFYRHCWWLKLEAFSKIADRYCEKGLDGEENRDWAMEDREWGRGAWKVRDEMKEGERDETAAIRCEIWEGEKQLYELGLRCGKWVYKYYKVNCVTCVAPSTSMRRRYII